jgi:3-isopropylmalate/(R)-2-methylmalate dehydratase large subunit
MTGGKSLLDKVWESHSVRELPDGQTQLFIGLHMLHEVTSPQAFAMIRDLGVGVKYPTRTYATIDHIIPTDTQARPYADGLAEEMAAALADNCRDNDITYFDVKSGKQGVIHVVGPERGLTQPGMTIVCGDSHTATHGAFGAISFGIGTSQVRDVLATQTMAMRKPKLRQVRIEGTLGSSITAKDVALAVIHRLGVKGGVGYAYEFAGSAVASMTMEERLTLCNMSIEGGARIGYCNPDQTTIEYLRGREYVPTGEAFDRACDYWLSIASDDDAVYDDVVTLNAAEIEPMVTWGINPEQAAPVTGKIPTEDGLSADEKASLTEALAYMKFEQGADITDIPINVAFIGSCTNGRIEDLRAAAAIAKGQKVAPGIRTYIVPGSMEVMKQAVQEGLDKIFIDAGFDWRLAGCSMCLAMNPDKLDGDEICASSSNRNFKGRQGSPTGRTLLMSPAMVTAAAIAGKVVDVRNLEEV